MNAYEEDFRRIIRFTQDKFIPEYIYSVSTTPGPPETPEVAEDTDEDGLD